MNSKSWKLLYKLETMSMNVGYSYQGNLYKFEFSQELKFLNYLCAMEWIHMNPPKTLEDLEIVIYFELHLKKHRNKKHR